jgi:glutathione S-transferase
MSDPIVFGFPYSTFVHIVRLILTHKGAAYTFRDLETEMGKPTHLALHPFNRVPVLKHDDFTVYETSAIATYIDRRSRIRRFSQRTSATARACTNG